MKIKKTKIIENLKPLREADGDDDDLDLDNLDLDDIDFDDADLDGLDDLDGDEEKTQKVAPKEQPAPQPQSKPQPQPKSEPAPQPKQEQPKPAEAHVDNAKTLPSGDVVGTTKKPSKPSKVRQVIDLQNLLDLKGGNLPKNAVYSVLNRSLRDSKIAAIKQRVKKQPDANFARDFNILVEGLPGGGKTATIKAWAEANGVNLVAVNAKDPDLELAINGAVMRDLSNDSDKNSIVMAYSKLLAPLEEPNSILFLDEYNRQTDDQIRASLLTLIGEHCIYGQVGGQVDTEKKQGYHFFKNMLFTVAAINPAVPQDKGAAKLNDAEMSRFLRRVVFDSSPKAAASYFKWYFDKELKAITDANQDTSEADPAYAWVYATTFLQKHIAIYLTTSPDFRFDTKDDLQDLYNGDKTMFNQRLLTQLIASLVYHPEATMAQQILDYIGKIAPLNLVDLPDQAEDDLRDWSNILDKDKDMLEKLLKDYKQPPVNIPGYGDISQLDQAIDDDDVNPDEVEDEFNDDNVATEFDDLVKQAENGEEIDNDLFANDSSTDSATGNAVNTQELDAITNAINNSIDNIKM